MEPFAAGRQRAPMRAMGEPVGEVRVDPVARPGAGAERPEENLLVVAENDRRLAILEQAHDLVGEAVLVDAVAEADQLVDLAHQPERVLEARGVAVNIGDDAELHWVPPVKVAWFRYSPRRWP